ncbi:contractile injection system tape measure protein [Aquimarina agarilytica]|uniref:contractile injection system tape measure protein n=1 Tax=Aquimarina agarilytica TaxID=1087449 RepID=UPI0002887276|nr:contractile injection system tape measure protein [Aquimarina agarilytica]
MANNHLIGKQILELEVKASDPVYSMQQHLSELVWNVLLPELSKLFDRLVSENEVVSIDSITLNIGEINLSNAATINNIVNKIVALLTQEIKNKLKEVRGNKKDVSRSASKNERGINEPSFLRELQLSAKEKEAYLKQYLKEKSTEKDAVEVIQDNNKHQSIRRYYFELWLHWLQKGTFKSYTILPESNWLELVLETLAVDINAVSALKKVVAKYPMALQRLILQHTTKNLISIVELYTTISQTKLIEFFKELNILFKEPALKLVFTNYRAFEIKAWQLIFECVILQREKMNTISLGIHVIRNSQIGQSKDLFKEHIELHQNKYAFINVLLKEEYTFVLNKSKTKNRSDSVSKAPIFNEGAEVKLINIQHASIAEQEVESFEKKEALDELPQFFKNAGIVLIHPFLKHLFEKLDLITGSEFTDSYCQSKAVLVIHFLATAKEKAFEYELVLPKFLCGIPANLPVDHTITITKEEKEEATNLLTAAIDHWGALGSTSPDGLREGFLSREGKLDKQETGWKLIVERKTLDILLNRLPWNISIIKLPWMEEVLYVEWI